MLFSNIKKLFIKGRRQKKRIKQLIRIIRRSDEMRKKLAKTTCKYTRCKRASMVGAITLGVLVSGLSIYAQGVEQKFAYKHYEEKNPAYEVDAKIPYIVDSETLGYSQKINDTIAKQMNEVLESIKQRVVANQEAYLATGGTLEELHPTSIAIDYDVRYNNNGIVSFVITSTEAGASFHAEQFFFNLDLTQDKEITLEQLFGKDYKTYINSKVKEQMKSREVATEMLYFEDFKGIKEDQNFYINAYGNPVIVFDKYEIGPGVMGIQSFQIQQQEGIKSYESQVSYTVDQTNEGGQPHIAYPKVSNYKGELLEGYINQSLYSIVEKYSAEGYSNLSLGYDIKRMDEDVLSILYRGSVELEGIGYKPIMESISIDMAQTGAEITAMNYIKETPEAQVAFNELMETKCKQKGLESFEAEGLKVYFKDDRAVFYYTRLDDQAVGPVELTVGLDELEGIVNKEFKEVYHS